MIYPASLRRPQQAPRAALRSVKFVARAFLSNQIQLSARVTEVPHVFCSCPRSQYQISIARSSGWAKYSQPTDTTARHCVGLRFAQTSSRRDLRLPDGFSRLDPRYVGPRNDGASDMLTIPDAKRRVLHDIRPRKRAGELPVARCTRRVSRAKKHQTKNAHEHTGSSEKQSEFPATMALRLIPRSPRRANSSCHRRCRLDGSSNPVDRLSHDSFGHQQRVSDHTVLPYAKRRRSCAPVHGSGPKARPADFDRANAAASTTIPPASVRSRYASWGMRRRGIRGIW